MAGGRQISDPRLTSDLVPDPDSDVGRRAGVNIVGSRVGLEEQHFMKNRMGPVAAAVTVGVLTLAPTPASAIVGGAPDAEEHPAVGQLLFYVPTAVDSRFDDPGGWFNCTGTLIDPNYRRDRRPLHVRRGRGGGGPR